MTTLVIPNNKLTGTLPQNIKNFDLMTLTDNYLSCSAPQVLKSSFVLPGNFFNYIPKNFTNQEMVVFADEAKQMDFLQSIIYIFIPLGFSIIAIFIFQIFSTIDFINVSEVNLKNIEFKIFNSSTKIFKKIFLSPISLPNNILLFF